MQRRLKRDHLYFYNQKPIYLKEVKKNIDLLLNSFTTSITIILLYSYIYSYIYTLRNF
jgi:hypothetical protein